MPFVGQPTPTAITQATTFLTQPLFLTHLVSNVAVLQLILQSTLTTAFFYLYPGTLVLSLSSVIVPPPAIYAACIALNLSWLNWMSVLGASAFEMRITSSRVSVHMPDGRSTTVWETISPTPSSFLPPGSPLLVSPTVSSPPASPPSLVSVQRSSVTRRTRSPTLAQQLLESSPEDGDADEMFTLLSKCDLSVISPTSTTVNFSPVPKQGVFHFPPATNNDRVISLPDSDSDSDSRPSSRFSFTSNISLSSFASSSHTFHSYTPSVGPSAPSLEPEKENDAFVDNTKVTPKKYMYHGGMSTVLTGGVMLGSTTPASANRTTTPQATGKETIPTETTSVPVWRPRMRVAVPVGPHAENWRRVRSLAVSARR
jgi:hypothetical protein